MSLFLVAPALAIAQDSDNNRHHVWRLTPKKFPHVTKTMWKGKE